jgi:hypothetical protein
VVVVAVALTLARAVVMTTAAVATAAVAAAVINDCNNGNDGSCVNSGGDDGSW